MALSRVPSHQFTVDSNITIPTGKKLNAVDTAGIYAPGHILQVVQTLKTDTFATTSTTWVDVTGLSVSITPKFSTSKIMIMTFVPFSRDGTGGDAFLRLLRNGSTVGNGNSGYFSSAAGQYGLDPTTGARVFLDSPATTSTITYNIQVYTGSNTVYVGTRRINDFVYGSDITVMEIAQ